MYVFSPGFCQKEAQKVRKNFKLQNCIADLYLEMCWKVLLSMYGYLLHNLSEKLFCQLCTYCRLVQAPELPLL